MPDNLTIIQAPFATPKVSTTLPAANFLDSRGSQASVTIKRSMLGRVMTYVTTTSKQNLSLTFSLTRQKDEELAEFILVYKTAEWKITLHDDTVWKAGLVGEPIKRMGGGKIDSGNTRTGDESVSVTLKFSAEKVV